MSLTWARLTFRLARSEIIAFGAVILALIAASLLAASWVDSARPPANCFSSTFDGAPPPGCEQALNAWYSAQQGVAGLAAGLLVFVSFAAGLFLGVPIVARELERGTARLAWSLTPSRTRWYAARMVPILIALAIVTYVAGVAVERFVAATNPLDDLANSFTAFGYRGLLIASRAIFIFAVAVAVGAIVGRTLTAVIFAAIIASIGLAGGQAVHERILETEAVAIPMDMNGNGATRPGDRFISQKWVLPDGSLVDYGYFGGTDPYDQNGMPKYPVVAMVLPGERYRFVETREAAALAGGSLLALVLAAFVVSRRRPG